MLNKVVLSKWELGFNKLPALEFSHLFQLQKTDLVLDVVQGHHREQEIKDIEYPVSLRELKILS